MLTISGASRRPWDPEERVPTSPFHRQRKWESDWTASLYSYTTQEGQELGTWFPDSWVSVPHGMLPSPKHYFCKRFSFNKGTRTSHVTFIHESQCVCISTLVVGSREGAGTGTRLSPDDKSQPSQAETQAGQKKESVCGLSSHLTGALKICKSCALRLQQAMLWNINSDCVLPSETFLLSHNSFTLGCD